MGVCRALLELVQLRSVLRANGRRTVAEILASAVEAGFAVGFVATYTVNVSHATQCGLACAAPVAKLVY